MFIVKRIKENLLFEKHLITTLWIFVLKNGFFLHSPLLAFTFLFLTDDFKIQRVLQSLLPLVRRHLVLFSDNRCFYCLCNYLVVTLSYYGH